MQSARNYLRPQCMDIGKSLQISAIIEIGLIAIIFIMLIFAASYNNMVSTTQLEDGKKKEKYINGLIISSAVLSTILLAVGIWHMFISGKAKKCLIMSPRASTI